MIKIIKKVMGKLSFKEIKSLIKKYPELKKRDPFIYK